MDPIAAVITSTIMAAASIAAAYSARRKIKAEAENVHVSTAEDVVKLVRGQMSYMTREMEELRQTVDEYRQQVLRATEAERLLREEVDKLRSRIGSLERFIRDHGLEPPNSNGVTR